MSKDKKISEKKLCDLIQACINFGADDDGFITKTKLAKLVYLADFVYYYENLVPITGLYYRKMEQGPVALEYFDKLTDLVGNNKIKIERKRNAQMISLRNDYNATDLSEKELAIIKKICKKWKNKNTEEIVKFTHEQIPWKISFKNENVPYSLIIQQNATKLY